MIPELLQSRHEAPRKRFRGKARYFRKVLRKARNFSLTPEAGSEWNLWHYHADWPGWGNLTWSYRLGHLKALSEVFRTIARAGHLFPVPFQCWILISGRDAGEDATYLHSLDPFQPEGVDWDDDRLLPAFEGLLPEYSLRVGHVRRFDESAEPARETSTFYVYSPEVGVPMEK